MNNPTKTFLFLAAISTLMLLGGYALLARQGLLLGFSLAITLNFFVYFYSEHRLRELFSGQEIEGHDPWGLIKEIQALAYKMRIPPPTLIVIPIETPTAFSLGRSWDTARVVFSKGLLDKMSRDEVKAVLAHEMAHIKKLDTLSFGVGSALSGGFIAGAFYLDRFFYWVFRSKNKGPGFFTSLFSPLASLVLRLTVQPQSEFDADDFAAESIGDPEILARSLWKLKAYSSTLPIRVPISTAHLFVVNPLTMKGTNRYFHTLPSVESRIERLVGRYPI